MPSTCLARIAAQNAGVLANARDVGQRLLQLGLALGLRAQARLRAQKLLGRAQQGRALRRLRGLDRRKARAACLESSFVIA